jgi:hypothetical protein
MQLPLLQVQLEGLQEAAKTSPLNGALVGFIILLLTGIGILWKQIVGARKDIKELNESHVNRLEDIRKEYVSKFEKLQEEYLKREEDRNKQWTESEKQTLQVLNGVTNILEMSEKMGQKDTHEILEKIKLLEIKLIAAINEKK